PVFATGLGLVVFDTCYSIWIISELFGAVLIPRLRQRGATRVRRDRGSGALIILTLFLSITIAFSLGYQGIWELPDWTFYLGISLMLVGVVVRQWAIAILGRFFSMTVRIAEDHKVVENGPYRFVRHPSYTGVLITFIGLGLSVQSGSALFLLLIVFGVSFGYRMRVEERTLLSELGRDYANYMKKTKRLIPFLI
ncbi:MAG TPA: isoprenylcysteine carboxylmethyltransferase family protein, partial [Candidatus Bathyarchaeia archaeon]|nr:isoprenylcysteine carboxylmethyltransferase family protein [Candidatus Bathyarchaeia archaeon]